MINNYGNMNIIDLNKDDDSNTSSTYSPPIIYKEIQSISVGDFFDFFPNKFY